VLLIDAGREDFSSRPAVPKDDQVSTMKIETFVSL